MGLRSWWRATFPHQVQTFEEFIQLTNTQGCSVITCSMQKTSPWRPGSMEIGAIGLYVYRGIYRAKTKDGAWLELQETYTRRWGSDRGSADYEERMHAKLVALYTTYRKFQQLKAMFSQLEVKFVNIYGQEVEPEMIASLERKASRANISPALPMHA